MSTQVLIVGGGIGGLTLAAMCRRIGVSCRVLERSAALEPVGAGISLAPNALRALDQIGLYDYVRQEGQPVRKIRVYRNQTQWSEIDFQWLERTFGYPVYSVERHGFHRRLYDAAGGSETVILGAEVAKVIPPQEEAEGVSVVLKDGRRYTGNVLVGADGVRSVVRRALMATINSPPGQSGAVGEDEDAADVIQFTGRVHLSGYTHPLDHLGPADEGIAHWMLYDRSILTTWPCRDHRQWFVGAVVGIKIYETLLSHQLNCASSPLSSRTRIAPSGNMPITTLSIKSMVPNITPLPRIFTSVTVRTFIISILPE